MEKNKTQIIPLPNLKKKNFNAAEYKANNILGRKIEEARRAKGVSMRGLMTLLAEYGLDLDYQIVYKWEKGKTVPNAIQLLAVCEALEIPDAYRYLTDGEDDLNERTETWRPRVGRVCISCARGNVRKQKKPDASSYAHMKVRPRTRY